MELLKRPPDLAACAKETKGVEDLGRIHVFGHAALDCIFKDGECGRGIHLIVRLVRLERIGYPLSDCYNRIRTDFGCEQEKFVCILVYPVGRFRALSFMAGLVFLKAQETACRKKRCYGLRRVADLPCLDTTV